jgi:hypothetical protein
MLLSFAHGHYHLVRNINESFAVLNVFDNFSAKKSSLKVGRILQFGHDHTLSVAPLLKYLKFVFGV